MKKQVTDENCDDSEDIHLSHCISVSNESDHPYPDKSVGSTLHNKDLFPYQIKHHKYKTKLKPYEVIQNIDWDEPKEEHDENQNKNNSKNEYTLDELLGNSKSGPKLNVNNQYYYTNISSSMIMSFNDENEIKYISSIPIKKTYTQLSQGKFKEEQRIEFSTIKHKKNKRPLTPKLTLTKTNKELFETIPNIPSLRRTLTYNSKKWKYIIVKERIIDMANIRSTVKKKKKKVKPNIESEYSLVSFTSGIDSNEIAQLRQNLINNNRNRKHKRYIIKKNKTLDKYTTNYKLKEIKNTFHQRANSQMNEVKWNNGRGNEKSFIDNSTLVIMKDLNIDKNEVKNETQEQVNENENENNKNEEYEDINNNQNKDEENINKEDERNKDEKNEINKQEIKTNIIELKKTNTTQKKLVSNLKPKKIMKKQSPKKPNTQLNNNNNKDKEEKKVTVVLPYKPPQIKPKKKIINNKPKQPSTINLIPSTIPKEAPPINKTIPPPKRNIKPKSTPNINNSNNKPKPSPPKIEVKNNNENNEQNVNKNNTSVCKFTSFKKSIPKLKPKEAPKNKSLNNEKLPNINENKQQPSSNIPKINNKKLSPKNNQQNIKPPSTKKKHSPSPPPPLQKSESQPIINHSTKHKKKSSSKPKQQLNNNHSSHKHIKPLIQSPPSSNILDDTFYNKQSRERFIRKPFTGISQDVLDRKKMFFIDLMKDPSNPYSLYYTEKLLKGNASTVNLKGTNGYLTSPYSHGASYTPAELSNIDRIKRFQFEQMKQKKNYMNSKNKDMQVDDRMNSDEIEKMNLSTFYNGGKGGFNDGSGRFVPTSGEKRNEGCKKGNVKLMKYPSIYKYFAYG